MFSSFSRGAKVTQFHWQAIDKGFCMKIRIAYDIASTSKLAMYVSLMKVTELGIEPALAYYD